MLQRAFPESPRHILHSLTDNRHLLQQLVRRGVIGRYRGSVFGLAWSLLIPLLMLGVYTFVFSVVFKAKWNHPGAEDANFGVILFSGMIVHALFTESMVMSPGLVTGNAQYVKKVVFPLEILSWSAVFASLFQTSISFGVLLLFMLVTGAPLHPTLLYLPLVLLPLVLMALGVSWLLAATSVYVRDIRQIVGILATVMLFISPVFYPVDRLPERWQAFIYLNPISFIVDQVRNVVIYGVPPNWLGLGIYTLIAGVIAWLGLVWFQRLRTGFADVL